MMVYRDESDKWLANEAVKAGVELKTALATDLIWETKNGETPRVVLLRLRTISEALWRSGGRVQAHLFLRQGSPLRDPFSRSCGADPLHGLAGLALQPVD